MWQYSTDNSTKRRMLLSVLWFYLNSGLIISSKNILWVFLHLANRDVG